MYSAWHALPLTSKHLYYIFKSSPSSVRAEYLLLRYAETAGRSFRTAEVSVVSKALRFPICTPSVLDIMLRMPSCPPISTTLPTELPRRLFRPLTSRLAGRDTNSEPLISFLRFLYSHPKFPPPDPNSWEGYALTKSVAAGCTRLVQFLLDKGASPRYKNGLAVHAAIRQKDLALVKMLIEPDQTPPSKARDDQEIQCRAKGGQYGTLGSKRVRSEVGSTRRSAKKRRLEDRVVVDREMLKTAVACDARDIVNYFIHEKSCVPDMQTIKLT